MHDIDPQSTARAPADWWDSTAVGPRAKFSFKVLGRSLGNLKSGYWFGLLRAHEFEQGFARFVFLQDVCARLFECRCGVTCACTLGASSKGAIGGKLQPEPSSAKAAVVS